MISQTCFVFLTLFAALDAESLRELVEQQGNSVNVWQCDPNPCLNGGTCMVIKQGYALYTCMCCSGFGGAKCTDQMTPLPPPPMGYAPPPMALQARAPPPMASQARAPPPMAPDMASPPMAPPPMAPLAPPPMALRGTEKKSQDILNEIKKTLQKEDADQSHHHQYDSALEKDLLEALLDEELE